MSTIKPRRNFRRTQGGSNTTTTDNKKKQHSHRHEEINDDDENVCVICANPIKFAAWSPCNHKTCHKCSFRQLALFDKKSCLICRTDFDNNSMIFTEKLNSQASL